MKGQVSSLPSGRLFRRFAIFTLLVSLSLFILVPAQAATLDVTCDVVELATAVFTANSNGEADTINLAAGCDYFLQATLTLDADGGNPLTVNGNGATLDGGSAIQVLQVNAGTVLNLDAVTVTNSVSAVDGGGIVNNGGTLTLTNSAVTSNTTFEGGGGIVNDGGTLTLTNTNVDGNTAASNGGGILNQNGGIVTLTDSTVSLNTATFDGGGIFNDGGTLTLINTNVDGNTASDGGGILNQNGGIVTLTNSTVSLNTALNFGGGIRNNGGTLTLTNSILEFNNAVFEGGGIYNVGGSVTLTNSTLNENTSNTDGGGIYNSGGSVTLTTSTLWANFSSTSGAIHNSGTVTLINTTVASNGGSSAGSLYNQASGVVNLGNNILANSVGPECFNAGTITPTGPNLIEDGSCSVAGAITGDPTFGAFGLAGPYVPLIIFSLLVPNPAVDSGDNGICPPTDQRGAPRPLDGDGNGSANCDLGSYELDGNSIVPPPITVTPGATLIAPTSDVPPPPPTPLCEDHNFAPGGVVRASTRDGLDYAINCRVLYQNGQPTDGLGGDLYNSGSIGVEGIFELGIQQAVDIFSPVGRTYFEGGAVFCLRGRGTLIWLAASGVPRHAEVIGSYTVDDFPGFTCATLFEPGTLVLVRDNPISS